MRTLLLVLNLCVTAFAFASPPPRIKFIENKNQWNKGIHFVSQIPGGSMVIREGGFGYYFLDQKKMEALHQKAHTNTVFNETDNDALIDGVFVEVSFVGSNKKSIPVGLARSTEYYNYFLGSDRDRWASEAYGYQGFLFSSFYKGIDLKVYEAGANVKYDLVVAPGGDPSVIRIQYEGTDQLYLDNGNLFVKTRITEIIEKRPYAYQIINGIKVSVPCEFQLDDNQVSFIFPAGFDACYELVIDPLLIFSTFSGSEADNWGSTATPGENGKLYSAGVTNHFVGNVFSGNFPATAGSFQVNYGGQYDVAILKYDSLGRQLLYASYLGGSASESPHSMVVNSNNELVMLGTTSSLNFPTSANAYKKTFSGGIPLSHVVSYQNGSDIFVARISPDGKQLLASTYLGGGLDDGINFSGGVLTRNYGDALRGDIICDTDNNIYLSSVTASQDIDAVNEFGGGPTDAILVKLPPDLQSLTWARYLGGSGTDAAHTLKLDASNNILLAGGTNSIDFPITAGSLQTILAGDVDGWVARVSNNGLSVMNSTFTGSANFDQVYFLDLNADQEVYVYGQTNGTRPITPPTIFSNPNSGQFLQKFNTSLTQQVFYTVFGTGKGTPDISPTAFLVNDCNNLFMSGWGGALNSRISNGWSTSTNGLEVTPDALQSTTLGHDFYFLVLAEDATLQLYATYLGGNLSATHVDGGTSRFDKSGIVYHAVCAGCRSGTPNNLPASDFPTTPGAWSNENESQNCNNAAFKFDLSSLKALAKIRGGIDHICLPSPVIFENNSIGGEQFFWNFGDGTPIRVQSDPKQIIHEYKDPGIYTVWLKAYDPGTCKTSDSVSLTVYVNISDANFPDDTAICSGSSQTFTASGGVGYEWISKDGKYHFNGPTITVSPTDSTLFYISVTETSGCVSRDSVLLGVVPLINPEFEFDRVADCSENMPKLTVKNLTDSLWAGDHVYFDFGDGTTSDLTQLEHLFEESGRYNVKVVAVREFCVTEKVVPLNFGSLKFPNVITPGVLDGKNDTFTIQYGKDPEADPSDFGFRVALQIYDRWGRPVYENDDYKSDWAGAGLSTGVYYYEATVQDHDTCKGWVHLVK
jgi:hypothetical protein